MAGDHGNIRKLSILVPVFNERPTVAALLQRVLDAPLPCEREILVVDDGSTDGSAAILEQVAAEHPCVRVLTHDRNLGKGRAIRTAIPHITGDWALIQDADLEYDAADYDAMLLPAQKGIADAVFGSRFVMGRYRRAMYFWHTVANKLLTLAANLFSGLNLTDMETCYKLIRADILKSLDLRSNRFDIEPELTLKLALWGARVYEVPISYQGRTYAEGKKIGAKDAVVAFLALLKYRFFQKDFSTDRVFMALRAIERARSFNRWLFSQFADHLGDEVLEAGCGIGNLTTLLLNRKRLVCLDVEPHYVERVQLAYGHLANVSVRHADLCNDADLEPVAQSGLFDSAIAINVIEHIEDDVAVLKRLFNLLKPGGNLVVLAPQHPCLYSIDRYIGHYRRYTRAELTAKLEEAGFTVSDAWGFNRVGGFGWRVSGKILRRKTLSPHQILWFERFMPLIRILERIPFHKHASLIAIGKKPA